MSFLKGRFLKRLFTGLIFSIVGYFLMAFQSGGSSFFTYGILCFILCHIFYIRGFYLDFRSAPELDKKGARIAIIVTFLLSIFFYFYIRPSLGKAQLPVLLCTLLVGFMIMMASFRHQRVNSISFNLILGGVMLFTIADMLFCYFSFLNAEFSDAGVLMTLIFVLAQSLILAGGLSRKLIYTQSE